MRIGKIGMILIMTALICGLFTVSATADDMTRSRSDAQKMMHKLGRGIVNVLTGWMEIPKNIATEWKETDPFSGVVIGTIKGAGWTWGRTMSGAYDIITFPLPVPDNYETLMEPELILPDIWGEDFPHYDDDITTTY